MIYAVSVLACVIATANAKVYFKENFNDEGWKSRWAIPTDWKAESDLGEWAHTAGEHYADSSDKGIKTSEDARFYGLSAKLNEAFTNTDKPLVLQMSVKHEQSMDCGGAYIKLLGDMDQSKFGGDTPYQVMFGPDICGSTKRTHAIFNYPPKNENLLIKNDVRVETDKLTHVYTMIVNPDNSFDILIDNESVRSGNLNEAWDFLLPAEIKDPAVSKPADWVDAKKVVDPEDVKPEGYDDIAEEIADPEAAKPDDWDDEEDGEWEAPMIDNPEFKGAWKAKMIDNPEYKGEWEHPVIPNPDYIEDKELYVRCKDCTHIGFELWQVKSGTIFDDILVTDSIEEAREYAEATWGAKKAGEKAMFDEKEAAAAAAAQASAPADEEMEGGAEADAYDEDEESEANDEL
jgi:calreticulin